MALGHEPRDGGGARRPRRKSSSGGDASFLEKLETPLRRFHAWKSRHQYLGRYSVEKLCAFYHYQESTPLWRVAAVIAVSPLPVFLALLLMDVVPMNDPRKGAKANGVAFARSVIAHVVLPSAILLSTKQALQLSDRHYSIAKIFRIGLCVSVALEFVCVGLAFVWRFPVPFREVTAIPLFVVCVAFFNWYFGWDELRKKIPKLRYYLPMVTMQLSMYYSFLCLAVAFAYFSSTTQIVLVLIFPGIKLVVKRAVWSQAQKLDDLTTDVTICFVELTGALYQTVCLQNAKSQALQYVILFSDLFQALYEVRAYLFHEYITDGVSTVHTAVRIVLGGVFPGTEERPTGANKKSGQRTLLPSFVSSTGGGSVFLKPRMVRKSQTRQLLDLNQYKVEVDLPARVGETTPLGSNVAGRITPPTLPIDKIQPAPQGRDELVADRPWDASLHLPPDVEIAPARRRNSDVATVLSARSAVSSAASPSAYQRPSTARDDSGYGLSRATTGSPGVSSAYVSPAQEADSAIGHPNHPQDDASTATRPRVLPPLRHASSHLASLGHISLGYDAHQGVSSPSGAVARASAFSVYDPTPAHAVVVTAPTPPLAHRASIMATLMDVEAERATASSRPGHGAMRRSSSSGKLKPRRSKRGSAVVHPGVHNASTAASGDSGSSAAPRRTSAVETAVIEPLVDKHGDHDVSARSSSPKDGGESVTRVTRVMIDGIQLPRKDQARVLEQTLQLLFSCEVLVFVEFLEVLLPTMYGLVVGGLWPLYNARYNLLFIGMTHETMIATVASSFAYAALESLSLFVLVIVMKKRYGISALHLLAFVLEKYWKVLYGKLVGSFLVIWLTLSVHLGTDFTFTFDYGVILERFGCARFQG